MAFVMSCSGECRFVRFFETKSPEWSRLSVFSGPMCFNLRSFEIDEQKRLLIVWKPAGSLTGEAES
jgi:hypothetical protein